MISTKTSFTEKQIIRDLKEHEGGKRATDIIRELGIVQFVHTMQGIDTTDSMVFSHEAWITAYKTAMTPATRSIRLRFIEFFDGPSRYSPKGIKKTIENMKELLWYGLQSNGI